MDNLTSELIAKAREEAGTDGWFVGAVSNILHKNVTCTLKASRGRLRAPFGMKAEDAATLIASGKSRPCIRCAS